MRSQALRGGASRLGEIVSQGGPVLVVFELPDSEACREIEGVIGEVAREFSGRMPVVRVGDVTRENLADSYRVSEVPTVVFYNDGRETGRIEGTVGPASIRAHLEFLLQQRAETAGKA